MFMKQVLLKKQMFNYWIFAKHNSCLKHFQCGPKQADKEQGTQGFG